MNTSQPSEIKFDIPISSQNHFNSIKLDQSEKSTSDKEKNLYNILYAQYNSIISYYYKTCIYLFNCEQNSNIFCLNKNSKNFIEKNRIHLINVNNNNIGNYNDNINFINKNEYINNCEFNQTSNYNNLINCELNRTKNDRLNNKTKLNNNIKNNSYNYINCNILNTQNIAIKQIFNRDNLNYILNLTSNNNYIPDIHKKTTDGSLSNAKNNSSSFSILEKKEEEDKSNGYYIIEMYGKKGWICKLCNNFNYLTRVKCNRCGEIKNPKKIIKSNYSKIEEHNREGDWICIYCSNLNYSFRKVCNKCKNKKAMN